MDAVADFDGAPRWAFGCFAGRSNRSPPRTAADTIRRVRGGRFLSLIV
jgi:hypothetical protein